MVIAILHVLLALALVKEPVLLHVQMIVQVDVRMGVKDAALDVVIHALEGVKKAVKDAVLDVLELAKETAIPLVKVADNNPLAVIVHLTVLVDAVDALVIVAQVVLEDVVAAVLVIVVQTVLVAVVAVAQDVLTLVVEDAQDRHARQSVKAAENKPHVVIVIVIVLLDVAQVAQDNVLDKLV